VSPSTTPVTSAFDPRCGPLVVVGPAELVIVGSGVVRLAGFPLLQDPKRSTARRAAPDTSATLGSVGRASTAKRVHWLRPTPDDL
jgi:hypothetical protein